MSSEAAKKAYPDTENEAGSLSRSNAPVQREAFDRGAVEALRQAAEIAERYSKGYAQHPHDGIVERTQKAIAAQIRAAADEWERGSA